RGHPVPAGAGLHRRRRPDPDGLLGRLLRKKNRAAPSRGLEARAPARRRGAPFQCGEGSPAARNRNPVTLVTPTVRSPALISLLTGNERRDTRREETRTMTTHGSGTRQEWLAARLQLLEAEKELTRRSDELARQRQDLPWVRIDKEYRFATDEGSGSLKDLFRGRSQLIVYHFMFGPDYTAGCPSCSAIADGFDGFAAHLANHDVMLWAVSRAPLAKLQGYKRRMGWTFPWASSFGSDFNANFAVGFTEGQQREGGVEYNYRREAPLQTPGREAAEISR